MTPERARLVHETLPILERDAAKVARWFHARLVDLEPEVGLLGDDAALDAYGPALVAAGAAVMRALPDAPRFLAEAASLGRRLARLGVTAAHYESAADALQWTLEQALGDRCTREVQGAWGEAYAYAATEMFWAGRHGRSPVADAAA